MFSENLFSYYCQLLHALLENMNICIFPEERFDDYTIDYFINQIKYQRKFCTSYRNGPKVTVKVFGYLPKQFYTFCILHTYILNYFN